MNEMTRRQLLKGTTGLAVAAFLVAGDPAHGSATSRSRSIDKPTNSEIAGLERWLLQTVAS